MTVQFTCPVDFVVQLKHLISLADEKKLCDVEEKILTPNIMHETSFFSLIQNRDIMKPVNC